MMMIVKTDKKVTIPHPHKPYEKNNRKEGKGSETGN